MEHVILFRWHNGSVGAIQQDDSKIRTFPSLDDAVAHAEEHPLLQSTVHQIVSLDEL